LDRLAALGATPIGEGMVRVAGILLTAGIVAGLLVAVLRVTGETSSETCWRAHLNPKVDRVSTDISPSRVFLMDGGSAMGVRRP
jgi:hypothetical protein